jgi:uncharacterized membrane protein
MRYLIVLLALAGVTVSALLWQAHDSTGTLPHSIQDTPSCAIVVHSPYATIGSVPVAAAGVGGYVLLGILALVRRRVPLAAFSLAALVYSLYLAHIEKSVLHIWCAYCVLSLAIVSLLTGLAWWWAVVSSPAPKRV